jgi:hypothetical protein
MPDSHFPQQKARPGKALPPVSACLFGAMRTIAPPARRTAGVREGASTGLPDAPFSLRPVPLHVACRTTSGMAMEDRARPGLTYVLPKGGASAARPGSTANACKAFGCNHRNHSFTYVGRSQHHWEADVTRAERIRPIERRIALQADVFFTSKTLLSHLRRRRYSFPCFASVPIRSRLHIFRKMRPRGNRIEEK